MQDKTDWKKIFNQSQSQVDSEAYKDVENPTPLLQHTTALGILWLPINKYYEH